MNDTLRRALELRKRAMLAGLEPFKIECGPEGWGDLSLVGGRFAGMEMIPRLEAGLTVLAIRRGPVGRYEVVIPDRFEEVA